MLYACPVDPNHYYICHMSGREIVVFTLSTQSEALDGGTVLLIAGSQGTNALYRTAYTFSHSGA